MTISFAKWRITRGSDCAKTSLRLHIGRVEFLVEQDVQADASACIWQRRVLITISRETSDFQLQELDAVQRLRVFVVPACMLPEQSIMSNTAVFMKSRDRRSFITLLLANETS